MRWLDGSTNSVDVDLSKFPGDGEGPWSLEAQFMESRSDLATGPQQPSASRWQWNTSRVAQIKHSATRIGQLASCADPAAVCFCLQPFMGNSGEGKAPHSSTLSWEVPWTEEPGGLQSMGARRVGPDWVP